MRPISVATEASYGSFRFYEQGIYYDAHCSSEDLDHGVRVVCYSFKGAESNDNKYGIVKDSWGIAWCKNGYVKMAEDWNNHCGTATQAGYATVRHAGDQKA